MVKPIDMLGVCDEGLEFIETLTEHEQERVAEFLSILKVNRSGRIFPEVLSIPDDAPAKLKNEAAQHRGRFFKGASNCGDGCPEGKPPIGMKWYEANDRSVLYVWWMNYIHPPTD